MYKRSVGRPMRGGWQTQLLVYWYYEVGYKKDNGDSENEDELVLRGLYH